MFYYCYFFKLFLTRDALFIFTSLLMKALKCKIRNKKYKSYIKHIKIRSRRFINSFNITLIEKYIVELIENGQKV